MNVPLHTVYKLTPVAYGESLQQCILLFSICYCTYVNTLLTYFCSIIVLHFLHYIFVFVLTCIENDVKNVNC